MRADRLGVWSALSCALVLTAAAASAAPVFTAETSSAPVLPGSSRVVLFHHDGRTAALFSIDVDVQTADGAFAWVIPVPSAPTVAAADPLIVAELDALSAPRSVYGEPAYAAAPESAEAGCGCRTAPWPRAAASEEGGCGGEVGGSGEEGLRLTQLVTRVSFETLEVVVLSSGAGDDLGAWLADHGYAVGAGFADAVQPYVDADWYFAAARYLAPSEPPAQALALRLDYADPSFGYPTRALALTPTQVAHVPLTLMVAAEHQAVPSHDHRTLQDLAPEGWSTSFEYQALLERELLSDARLSWVVESAQSYHRAAFLIGDSPSLALAEELGAIPTARDARLYVTRLTTLATRLGAAASPDLELTLDPDAADVPNTVDLQPAAGLARAGAWRPPGGAAAGLLLALLLWARRRRERPVLLALQPGGR